MLVEVCANGLESALNAQKAGADRIELCSELAVGGITPSYGLLQSIKENITIPVHVLIRPRGGDFTYSNAEFDIMKKNIEICAQLGFNGIVSGVLFKNLELDVQRTSALIELAGNMEFTFHRAFDWVENPFAVAKALENMGVAYILSSGQQNSAQQGITLLAQLKKTVSKCTIMPGSGIHADNALVFKEKGFKAIHLSGTQFHKTLENTPNVSMNSVNFLHDDQLAISNVEKIAQLVKRVKE